MITGLSASIKIVAYFKVESWCVESQVTIKNTSVIPNIYIFIMSTPLGGGYIIFAFFAVRCPMSDVRCPASGVRCPASRMVSAHLKEKY